MTEKIPEWVHRVLAEAGPPSNDPIRNTAQKIEFDKKFAAARREAKANQARAAQQAELERYLRQRSEQWLDITSSTDGLNEELPRWRQQYLDAKAAEREARLAESIQENYDF